MEYDFRKCKKMCYKTKCVVMVHTYGLPSEAKQIEEFCNNNNIKLVEDSAEAHGQNYEDDYAVHLEKYLH